MTMKYFNFNKTESSFKIGVVSGTFLDVIGIIDAQICRSP